VGPNWPWLPLRAPFSVKSALSAGLNKSSLTLGNHAADARFSRLAALLSLCAKQGGEGTDLRLCSVLFSCP